MPAITEWPGLLATRGTTRELSWSDLVALLSTAVELTDKNAAPGWSAAEFRGPRSKANVIRVHFVVMDFDSHGVSAVESFLGPTQAIVHATWSSTREHPRCRAVLNLSRPVTVGEYE